MRLSARQRHVRTFIVNSEPAVLPHLHRLCVNRPDLDFVAGVIGRAEVFDLPPIILLYFSYSKFSPSLLAASVHETPTHTILPGGRTVSELVIAAVSSTTSSRRLANTSDAVANTAKFGRT